MSQNTQPFSQQQHWSKNPLQIHLNQTGGPSHNHQLSKLQAIPSKPHDPEEW